MPRASRAPGGSTSPVAFERDSLTRQGLVMPDAAIDACCLIDLLASGHAEAILARTASPGMYPLRFRARSSSFASTTRRSRGRFVAVPVDLSGLISSVRLTLCDPENQQELDPLFTTRRYSDPTARRCVWPSRAARDGSWPRTTAKRFGSPRSGPDRDELPRLVKRGRMPPAGSGYAEQGLARH